MTKKISEVPVGALVVYSYGGTPITRDIDIDSIGIVCQRGKKRFIREIHPEPGEINHIPKKEHLIILSPKFEGEDPSGQVIEVLLNLAFRIFCLRTTLVEISNNIGNEVESTLKCY